MIGESIKDISSITTLTEKEFESLEEAAFYESGLIAHGCLENLDDYARESIKRYGRWLVKWVKEEEAKPVVKENPAYIDIVAYTDGSGSEKTCGFGVVLLYQDPEGDLRKFHEEYGNLGQHSSRQIAGEIEAAIVAIKYALDNSANTLKIVHDYTGIGCWPRGEWKAKDADAKRLVEWNGMATDCGLEVTYEWTRGHQSDNKWNEYADKLATKGVKQIDVKEKLYPFLGDIVYQD